MTQPKSQKPDAAQRLASGVERLGSETSTLNTLLQRVNDQQVYLSKMDAKVEDVSTAKEEFEARLRLERKARMLLTLAVGGGIFTLAALLLGLSTSAYHACERRQEATRVNIEVLEGFKSGGSTDAALQRGIDRLNRTLDATCDEQYRLHL